MQASNCVALGEACVLSELRQHTDAVKQLYEIWGKHSIQQLEKGARITTFS
jgi:hypothetical protein